ncbi:ABC transporter ATP-binding protein [Phaeacidiphilus oryzae]|uniref:ABC transporter ATP-binding protein n=1 Tax=Phaeacidiphilus oryzae TaxID=348818 RepID=UPI000A547198|nr:ABC transporter ATP-binding protein [Phaeacidiphilus oryzae]
MTAAQPAVEVRDLVKRYRGTDRNAVDGVSFAVPAGRLFCLLGPNGAGKTTTVSILTTTLSPTSGTVRIAGHDLADGAAAVRRASGVVFQQPSLDANLTAEENLRLHAVLYGLHPWRPSYRLMPPGYRRQVGELAEVLGVEGVLGRRIRRLSGGTRRRLEIVRALMHRPRVLFLDEPTAGLDPESRRSLWAHLSEARRADGTTVFLTTHDLTEAEAADTVCVLLGGRIAAAGTPASLKARHARRELWLDAADREGLRRELAGLGLKPEPTEVAGAPGVLPLRVALDGPGGPGPAGPQHLLRRLRSELTRFQVSEPSLEEAYLRLLDEARSGGPDGR